MALTLLEKRQYLAVRQELEKRKAQRSLAEFMRQAWHVLEPASAYTHGWHIDAIAEHLEAVAKGQIRDLVINMPPRHMKSLAVSAMFPAWVWGPFGNPERRFVYTSYAESLAIRDSVKCRQVIQSNYFQGNWGDRFRLVDDQNEKKKYVNDKSGHRISTSPAGRGTGEGGDIIVCDDPHKVMEVESDVQRQAVLDWWDGEMSSRGNDPKTVAKIIVMQRVHEEDLSGHVLEQGGYVHLKLPAEYKVQEKKHFTSIGWSDPRTEEGELLWPERFGHPELGKLKKSLGRRRSAGQLDQEPSPADGDIVTRADFRYWHPVTSPLPPMEFWGLACDLTFKETKAGAFNTFQVWGRAGANKYLVFQVRKRMGFIAQLQQVADLRKEYPQIMATWIEDAANAQAMLDVLSKKIPGLILVHPGGSKPVRAEAVSPQFNAGNVWVPHPEICGLDDEGLPWVDAFIEEWIKVPNGKLWDQVDASVHAIRALTTEDDLDVVIPQMTKPRTFG